MPNPLTPEQFHAQLRLNDIKARGIAMKMQTAMTELCAAAFVGDGVAEQRARDMCHVLQDQLLDSMAEIQRLTRAMINGT